MNKFTTATATAALLIGVGYGSVALAGFGGDKDGNMADADVNLKTELTMEHRNALSQRAKTADEPIVTYKGHAMLSANGISARQLIGSDAMDHSDEKVAVIEDIVIDSNNQVTKVILQDGGFLGLGGKKVSIRLDQIGSIERHDDEMQAHIMVSESAIENREEFDRSKIMKTAHLVSELMGRDVDIPDSDRDAEIHDFIFQPSGKVAYVVLETGGLMDIGDKRIAVAFDKLYHDREKDEFRTSVNVKAIKDAEVFNYTVADVKYSRK